MLASCAAADASISAASDSYSGERLMGWSACGAISTVVISISYITGGGPNPWGWGGTCREGPTPGGGVGGAQGEEAD